MSETSWTKEWPTEEGWYWGKVNDVDANADLWMLRLSEEHLLATVADTNYVLGPNDVVDIWWWPIPLTPPEERP